MATLNEVHQKLQTLARSVSGVSSGVPAPIVDAQFVADVTAHEPDLTFRALGNYNALGAFITAMLPYGSRVVYFPDMAVPDAAHREPNDLLANPGVQVAGFLRRAHADAPHSSSSAEMKIMEENECFNWDFRFPDDPSLPADKTGEMQNLQITKAIRIPFVYRRASDGKLLVAEALIGVAGSGTG